MTSSNPQKTVNKPLRIALWIVQVLLAFSFGISGVMKSTMPIAELAKNIPWTPEVPVALVRFIGVAELAGAAGLILPAVTRILPGLTALAGAGLTVVMILATGFNLNRGKPAEAGATVVLAALAAFVAWGRYKKAPIRSRA